jgi:hypothetical protein
MRQSLARYSAPVSFVRAPSLAGFTTITPALKFSVHTGARRLHSILVALEETPMKTQHELFRVSPLGSFFEAIRAGGDHGSVVGVRSDS